MGTPHLIENLGTGWGRESYDSYQVTMYYCLLCTSVVLVVINTLAVSGAENQGNQGYQGY